MVSRLSKSDKSARVALLEGQEWSGGHPDGQRVIRRLYRLAGIGRAACEEGQEWSGGPHEVSAVVGRSFHMVESCQEALQEAGHGREVLPTGQELSEVPPGGPGKARRPSQRCGRGWETLPVGRG